MWRTGSAFCLAIRRYGQRHITFVIKKKDPKGKVLGACKKNCSEFIKQCEKGCENGEF